MLRDYGTWATALCVFSYAVTVSPQNAFAQDAAHQSEVWRLLNEAWDVTPTARALADNIFEAQVGIGNLSGTVHSAYAVTLIKQRRYPRALDLTRSMLDVTEDDLRLRWAEVWLLLVNRNYGGALERSLDLAKLVASKPAALTQNDVDSSAMLESVGTAIGYLEGPASSSLTAAVIDQRIGQIVGALDEQQLASFERGRKSILEDYTRRQQQSRTEDQQEQVEKEAQREADLQYLQVQRTGLVREQTELEQRQRQLEDDRRETASRLQQREQEARTIAFQLADDAAYMRSRLVLINSDLLQIDQQIAQTNDPTIRAILITQRNNLVRVHRDQLAELRATESRLAVTNQNLASIRNDRFTQQREFDRSQSELVRSRRSLDKALRRVSRQESDLVAPNKKASVRSRVQRKKTAAWSTYLPYPVEAERQRLLDALD